MTKIELSFLWGSQSKLRIRRIEIGSNEYSLLDSSTNGNDGVYEVIVIPLEAADEAINPQFVDEDDKATVNNRRPSRIEVYCAVTAENTDNFLTTSDVGEYNLTVSGPGDSIEFTAYMVQRLETAPTFNIGGVFTPTSYFESNNFDPPVTVTTTTPNSLVAFEVIEGGGRLYRDYDGNGIDDKRDDRPDSEITIPATGTTVTVRLKENGRTNKIRAWHPGQSESTAPVLTYFVDSVDFDQNRRR